MHTWKRICRHYKNQKIIKKPMLKAKMYVHGKVYVVILKIEKKKCFERQNVCVHTWEKICKKLQIS